MPQLIHKPILHPPQRLRKVRPPDPIERRPLSDHEKREAMACLCGWARGARGVMLAAIMLLATPAAAQRSAAESIADKFSADDAAAQRKAEEQRKKDAEAKAMQALREQARKRAEDALKAERARHKPATPQAPAATTTATPPAIDPKAEESDMLARAPAGRGRAAEGLWGRGRPTADD